MTTAHLAVPAPVAAAVSAAWPERGRAWVEAVPDELRELCARYRATPEHVFDAARYGFVVSARTDAGRLAFRASADPAAPHQAIVARALADLDVGPRIHEVVDTATGLWTVMDRVEPGTTLADAEITPAIIENVLDVLQTMAGQPAPSMERPKLTDWLRARLLDDNLADLAPGRTVAPIAERHEALAVLDDLASDNRADACLCHGEPVTSKPPHGSWRAVTGGRKRPCWGRLLRLGRSGPQSGTRTDCWRRSAGRLQAQTESRHRRRLHERGIGESRMTRTPRQPERVVLSYASDIMDPVAPEHADAARTLDYR